MSESIFKNSPRASSNDKVGTIVGTTVDVGETIDRAVAEDVSATPLVGRVGIDGVNVTKLSIGDIQLETSSMKNVKLIQRT
ncbi:hypothetical protein MASR2M66_26040 [Chloroflexota bacterium]